MRGGQTGLRPGLPVPRPVHIFPRHNRLQDRYTGGRRQRKVSLNQGNRRLSHRNGSQNRDRERADPPPSADISVIIQGDIREGTAACLASVGEYLPAAEVILATYENAEPPAGFHGRLIRVADPGDQPPFTRNPRAVRSNMNRQIATTCAGLAAASRPLALKLRSDARLTSDALPRLFAEARAADPARSRLIVPSFFTRNPRGVSGYLFHASDWFMFGETAQLRRFWGAGFVPEAHVSWFDSHRHAMLSTPTARRFRSRYTPEQHLSIAFARQQGYRVPDYVNDRAGGLVGECERFYAREFLIATPAELGCILPKYETVCRSRFQQIDCTLYADWIAMCARHAPEIARGLPSLPAPGPLALACRRLGLWPVQLLRHAISAGALWSIRRRRLRAERRAGSLSGA